MQSGDTFTLTSLLSHATIDAVYGSEGDQIHLRRRVFDRARWRGTFSSGPPGGLKVMLIPNTATNAPVLAALRGRAIAENSKSGYTVDGYEVRTHPDVVERLRELMTYTPDAQFQYVCGTPTLSTPSGVIFATAGGTDALCLRLPGSFEWGHSYADYDGNS
jgi:hypothetical protein